MTFVQYQINTLWTTVHPLITSRKFVLCCIFVAQCTKSKIWFTLATSTLSRRTKNRIFSIFVTVPSDFKECQMGLCIWIFFQVMLTGITLFEVLLWSLATATQIENFLFFVVSRDWSSSDSPQCKHNLRTQKMKKKHFYLSLVWTWQKIVYFFFIQIEIFYIVEWD